MKVRIIKGGKCLICAKYIPEMQKKQSELQAPLDLYDGDAEENQKQLDDWHINNFPVVQIIDDNNAVLYQFAEGTWSTRAINYKIQEFQNRRTQ